MKNNREIKAVTPNTLENWRAGARAL